MVLLPLTVLVLGFIVRLSESSRGDDPSETPKHVEERNIPISPVQAYRKKLQERARSQPVTHAVHPFPISNYITGPEGSREKDSQSAAPAKFLEYMQPLPARTNSSDRMSESADRNRGPGDLTRESAPPAPVYRDDPLSMPAASSYARSSDRRFVFSGSNPVLSPTTTTTDSPDKSAYYKILDATPREVHSHSLSSRRQEPGPAVSGEQESRVVEFRSCLMRDFEKVWISPVRDGEKFVPRNEMESTCRGYIEKIESLRKQCMEAMETLLQSKMKAAESEKKVTENRSWWRFLTFGKR